jgi:hypothetical protein
MMLVSYKQWKTGLKFYLKLKKGNRRDTLYKDKPFKNTLIKESNQSEKQMKEDGLFVNKRLTMNRQEKKKLNNIE